MVLNISLIILFDSIQNWKEYGMKVQMANGA
jgi:hypothetical protein